MLKKIITSLTVGLFLVVFGEASAPTIITPTISTEPVRVATPFLNPQISPFFAVLNDFQTKKVLEDLRGTNALISCLIEKESAGKEDVIGKAGEIGILQFKKQTFDFFSKKYNLELDIYNSYHQILLAGLMLEDGLGFHWTTYSRCVKEIQDEI